jgi:hypothetical protein
MCSVAQKNELLDRRHKLEARITSYENRILVVMKLDDDTQWLIANIDPQVVELLDDHPEFDSDEWLIPEKERITLPSALAAGEIERLSLELIAIIETELHKGQVTDTLKGIYLALGEKSLCF